MKIVQLLNTYYILPTIDVNYDHYYEGGLVYLDLNFSWLKWSLSISIIKDKD